MAGVDFSKLLSKPTDEISAPVAIPEGSYEGLITAYKFDEIGEKKTPACVFTVKLQSPGEDVDQDALATALGEKQLSDRDYRFNAWISEDAQYRVLELAQSMGLETTGRGGLIEIIPEMVNQPVLCSVTQSQSKNDPERVFANIDNMVGMAQSAAATKAKK